ncbi:hypothetical protein ABLE91_28025 [Aquabacter sp. CN5-332]|uniref:hypothetical protein n=1 Tax=Aquabacter sp. CN5-332 TaxID=3156608 RepID=UPI0032B38216
MKVLLTNARTGAHKHITVGFNWPIFLLLVLALLPIAIALGFILGIKALVGGFGAAAVILSQHLARRANEARARRLFSLGWRFADPSSLEARQAQQAWTLLPTDTSLADPPQASVSQPDFTLNEGSFLDACATEAQAPQRIYFYQEGPMKVPLTNPRTGEVKFIKIGWSWTLFFFSVFLGLPLFLRRLYMWGAVFVVLNIILLIVQQDVRFMPIALMCWLAQFGFTIFISIKGNALTARNLLQKGWRFANPDAVETKYAKNRWSAEVSA